MDNTVSIVEHKVSIENNDSNRNIKLGITTNTQNVVVEKNEETSVIISAPISNNISILSNELNASGFVRTLLDDENVTSFLGTLGINIKTIARAWLNYDGLNRSIRDSFNISSVSYVSAGKYVINFTNAFANTNYCVVAFARDFNSDSIVTNLAAINLSSTKTTTSMELISNYARAGNFIDSTEYNVVIF